MSKFFAASSSESDSDVDNVPEAKIKQTTNFQWSDSDSDSGKRIVLNAKDKWFEDLKNMIKHVTNHKKIKDFAKILSSFEDLSRAFEKNRKILDKDNLNVPKFYLRILVEIEDFIAEIWDDRDGRKALSKNNSKNLVALRQKFRKYVKNFETEMMNYRSITDAGEEMDDLSEEEKNHEDKKTVLDDVAKPAKSLKESVESGSDDDWSMHSDSNESSDGEDIENLTLDYFRKKTTDGVSTKQKTSKEDRKKRESKKITRPEEDDDDWTQVPSAEKPKLFAKDAEITIEAIVKKMVEKTAVRGKKGTDRYEVIEILLDLEKISKNNNLGDAIQVKILFSLLPAIFDYNPNMAVCMRNDMWELCMESMRELISFLETNTNITVGEFIAEESEIVDSETPQIRGSILAMIEKLDEEFIKILQSLDAHSTEYIERLRDERRVCELINRATIYLETKDYTTAEEKCRIFMKQIEHIHYKFESRVIDCDVQMPDTENPVKIMDKLCKFIYTKDNSDRIRTRAILCQIYHHAIHDKWFEARDLMLMSHLQDNITHSDIPTQILYNRAMVQLGLCAFRKGYIKDAHNCLVDIQSGGRSKELLAQGLLMQRAHERTVDQEKLEKRRQIPYHRHINLELLECIYLISAMLLEVPYLAAHELDARRRMISKNFHHVLRLSEKQAVVGPPETMREHIVAASKAMKVGDWENCRLYLVNDKMQQKVWSLMYDNNQVKKMLERKIQEESLRTYLFAHAHVYNSLCLQSLCDQFNLNMSLIHSIISKMIINDELMASLDEPTKTLVMHRTEPTHVQSLCLQLAEKVVNFTDTNEKLNDIKNGVFYKHNQQNKQRDHNRDNNRDHNREHNRENRDHNRDHNRENRDHNRDHNRNQKNVRFN